jgi:UDP-glucose:(heptosyl)LPS alpha-1,3-glucosyltransferase
MKIALAMENFSRYGGGAESYAVELANTLIRRGWEVHLYGYTWDKVPAEAIFHKIPKLPRLVPPFVRLLHFALSHKRLIEKEDFDVVLGFGNTLVMNVYQSHGGVHFLSNMRKSRAIDNAVLRFLKISAMFLTPKYHTRAWIESAAFRTSPRPHIVAISDMVRNDVSDYFQIPVHEINLVYNGIDSERFKTVPSQSGSELRKKLGFSRQVLFLFMAYDFRKKGVKNLIKAAGLLKQMAGADSFGVVVAGRPPSSFLRNLTRDLKLDNIVVFPGPTKTPEIFYAACDVFVLPTFYDACSLVVFEAMAAGLPAITSAWNGASGIITDGVDGRILNDPASPEELSSAMAEFLDPGVLDSASNAAKDTAKKYTLQANHEQMLEIIEKASSRGKARSL